MISHCQEVASRREGCWKGGRVRKPGLDILHWEVFEDKAVKGKSG
jgi:hypothetical protein